MRKKLVLMAGVALAPLYLALNPVPALATDCNQQYYECRVACEADPNCTTTFWCYCDYNDCMQWPPLAGCPSAP